MSGNIIGLYIPSDGDIQKCSHIAREIMTKLFEAGATYDKFIYPYFDSVVMNCADTFGIPLGTHALLWDMEKELAQVELPPQVQVVEFESDHSAMMDFLGGESFERELADMREKSANDNAAQSGETMLVGGFEKLLSGPVRPWMIREHSRCFCSFAEHIARIKGVAMQGIAGGAAVLRLPADAGEREALLEQISALYARKTGGRFSAVKLSDN